MNFRDPDPFKQDPLADPLTPEKIYIQMPDGTLRMDAVATAIEYGESHTPELATNLLRGEDQLRIEFDDGTSVKYLIETAQPASLAFGSDDLRHPSILASKLTDSEQNKERIQIVGSSITSHGTMVSPDINVGSHLIVWDKGSNVSPAAIKSFTLSRKDSNNDYREVSLNAISRISGEKSPQFEKLQNDLDSINNLLAKENFSFDQIDEDGFARAYKKVREGVLVYACRQGFGSAIVPQDEVFVYDSNEETLRGIRNIPTKGMMQATILEGVTKDMFQRETFTNIYEGQHDWTNAVSIESSTLHRLSRNTPFITYTWLNPQQEKPIITVRTDGELLGDEVLGSLMEGNKTSPSVSVNIAFHDNKWEIEATDPPYWIDDTVSFLNNINKASLLTDHQNKLGLQLGELKISVEKNPLESQRILEQIRRFVRNPGRVIGSRILKKWR